MSIPYDPEHITYFGETDYRNGRTRFGIKSRDRTRHMYIIGKSGVGKSTLLENMAIQDIQRGEGVAILDPHGSMADKMLDYVPEHRMKDVVYFAPFDTENPISFNVLEDVGHDKRHLVASGLMSSFKKIWVDAWSARMEYILNNILLALLEYPEATLLGVNRMLSDKTFRNKVVANITDPSVKSFWTDEFAKYGERYMQEAGAAIQNKIGQFTANPLVRNIIGQTKSSFDIRKVMDEQKILIINLSKGRIGEQNTSLLGSMIITKIYLSAMSRAEVTSARIGALPNFYFYVDEFQSFANETFADILAEARKYKLALVIAHQYVAQMEEKVRDAVFGNVGTTVSFRVGPLDAELLEKVFSPQFMSSDLINLGMAQIYLSLMINDIGSPPFSARTLPPVAPPTITFRNDVIEYSRITYAQPKLEVEKAIQEWYLLDAEMKEEKPQKKLRFPDDRPQRQNAEGSFRKPFSERVYNSGISQTTAGNVDFSSRPVYKKPPEMVKPFENAFTKPIEKEENFSDTNNIDDTKLVSPKLQTLLGAFDLKAPKAKPKPMSVQKSTFTNPKPRQDDKPLDVVKKNGSPFDGEKTLSDSIQPVKMAERGPSEKNRDLLRAVLQKVAVDKESAKVNTGDIKHPAAFSVPVDPPQPSLPQADVSSAAHDIRKSSSAPIPSQEHRREVSTDDLKKILE